MERQDGFRRHGYRAAVVLLLAATFVGLVGKLWTAATLVALAVVLVGAVEEINEVILRRGEGTVPEAAAASGAAW
jgi:hypothetical protein